MNNVPGLRLIRESDMEITAGVGHVVVKQTKPQVGQIIIDANDDTFATLLASAQSRAKSLAAAKGGP